MRLIDVLVSAFFDTFGITQPSEWARRRATWFIILLFTLIILGFISAGAILFRVL